MWNRLARNNMKTEVIEACTCGAARDDLETIAARSGFVLYWTVRCMKCGRETAKHRKLEGAVREWNARQTEKD